MTAGGEGLYTAGIGLEADTTETDSPPAGQAGSILGPVTLGCRGAGRGPVRATWPGAQAGVGSSIWTQLTSFRAWWDTRPGQEEAGSPGGAEAVAPGSPGSPHHQAHPTGGSPCGQTPAGRRPPGARPSCSISAASVPPASASAAAPAPGSWCSGGGEGGRGEGQGRAFRAHRPLPAPHSRKLTGFLLQSMKPIWPLG